MKRQGMGERVGSDRSAGIAEIILGWPKSPLCFFYTMALTALSCL